MLAPKQQQQSGHHPQQQQQQAKKPFVLQRQGFNKGIQEKLKIGQTNDTFEKEADSVADKVVNKGAEPNVQKAPAPPVQTMKVGSEQNVKNDAEQLNGSISEELNESSTLDAPEVSNAIPLNSPPPEDRSSWRNLSTKYVIENKLGLDYQSVINRFREVNGSHTNFYSWVRESIIRGWSKLEDPVPNIHEIKVTWKTEMDRGEQKEIPYIEAYSYEDAFAQAGRLGLPRNVGAPFYWVTKINNTPKFSRYDFSSSDAYTNYVTAKEIISRKGSIPADYVQHGLFKDLQKITGRESEIDALLTKDWKDRYLSDVLIDIIYAAQKIQQEEYRITYEKLKKDAPADKVKKLKTPDSYQPSGLLDWGFVYWLMNYDLNQEIKKQITLERKQHFEDESIREPDDTYELPEFLTDADHDFVYGHDVGETVGTGGIAAKDKFKIKYTPRPRNSDLGVEGYKSFLQINERLFVLRKYEGWYFIATKDGVTGWVEGHAIAFNPPEPNAEIYEVKNGDSLWSVAKKKYGLSKSTNKRLYINAIVYANFRANRYDNIEYTATPKWNELGDPYHYNPQLIEGTSIWIPSYDFVKKLEEAGLISDGSLKTAFWKELKKVWDAIVAVGSFIWEVVKGVAGFIAGLIVGILESIWDLISGIFEMAYSIIKRIVTTLIDAFTGELYRKAEELFEAIKNLTWEDVNAFFDGINSAIDEWWSDLGDRWNAEGSFTRWYNRGSIIGYVIAEIILTIVTLGGAAAVKWGARVFKYLGKAGKILEKILGVVTTRNKVDRMLPDEAGDLIPDKKKDKNDGEKISEIVDAVKLRKEKVERLSVDPQDGKKNIKSILEAEGAILAEAKGIIKNPTRTNTKKGDPNIDFKISGPTPYKWCDVKTPQTTSKRPLELQINDTSKSIIKQQGNSGDVMHLIDLKRLTSLEKAKFKTGLIEKLKNTSNIRYIND